MKNIDNNKPYPVKLGEKKPILQQQAAENERSLHWWINKILDLHIKSGKVKLS